MQYYTLSPGGFAKICPMCTKTYTRGLPALSRKDNLTDICSDCGTAEALEDFEIFKISYGSHKIHTFLSPDPKQLEKNNEIV
jgi:hypothetical protein